MVNNELLTLSFLASTILGLLFILLVYLIIRKTLYLQKRRKIENYKAKLNEPLFMLLSEGSLTRAFTSNDTLQKIAIEELLSHYVKILEGEGEKKQLTLLAALHLEDYYRKRLKSITWSQRMNALYHIEDFQLKGLLNNLVQLLERKKLSHDELVHVLRIIALFQHPPVFDLLTNRFSDLTEFEYRNILIRLNRPLFDQFVLHFHKSSSPLKKAILDVVSIKKEFHYLAFTEDIFSAYSGEIRLRALKALAEIGYVRHIEPYLELLYSNRWEERMIAAKLIGLLKEEKGIDRLIELLHDHIWWVRSQAGQAISQFPNGKEILRSVFETSSDMFAKDMAREWLHKGV